MTNPALRGEGRWTGYGVSSWTCVCVLFLLLEDAKGLVVLANP